MPYGVDTDLLKKQLKELGVRQTEKSPSVTELCILLSLDCNLRSSFCPFWGKKGACRSPEYLKEFSVLLSMKRLKVLFQEIQEFSPKTVTISGGEPLLSPIWHLVGQEAKKNNLEVSLVTNGVLVGDQADKILEVVDNLFISLGSCLPIEQVLDTGNRSYGQKTLKGMRRLSELKKKAGRPFLTLLYTISEDTQEGMLRVVNWIKEEGLCVDRIHFQHQFFLNNKKYGELRTMAGDSTSRLRAGYWRGLCHIPSKLDLDSLRAVFHTLKNDHRVSFFPWLRPRDFNSYYRLNKGVPSYHAYCLAPWKQANLFPNGDIAVCPDYVLGNINQQSFKSIWNGSKAQALRKHVMKQLFPVCRACCFFYSGRKS